MCLFGIQNGGLNYCLQEDSYIGRGNGAICALLEAELCNRTQHSCQCGIYGHHARQKNSLRLLITNLNTHENNLCLGLGQTMANHVYMPLMYTEDEADPCVSLS